MSRRLGFIGIGKMGYPMAVRLMDRGYELTVFDIRKEAIQSLVARGAHGAACAADVASEAHTVLVSLPTPEAAREVALGSSGVVKGSETRVYVDLSTIGPDMAEYVSKGLGEAGIKVLDAPVSGGVPGAERGTLTVMLSGPRQEFEEVQSVLNVIAKRVFFIGERPGFAQMMKLINNLLSATSLAASSEAFVLGVKAGLNPEIMLEVINASTGRNSATEDKFHRYILQRTFDYGYKTDLLCKDLKLCLDQADAIGVPMWVGNAVRQLWQYALTQGAGSMDSTRIIQYIEAWADTEVVRSR